MRRIPGVPTDDGGDYLPSPLITDRPHWATASAKTSAKQRTSPDRQTAPRGPACSGSRDSVANCVVDPASKGRPRNHTRRG
jgi:hypothetical protein